MIALSLTTRDGISPLLGGLTRSLRSSELRQGIGRSVRTVLVEHFRELGATRHRAGRPSNYYATAADRTAAVEPRDDGASVRVAIPQPGMARHYFGPAKRSLVRLTAPSDGALVIRRIPPGGDRSVLPTARQLLAAAAAGAAEAIGKGGRR